MRATFRAELVKLLRARVLVLTFIVTAVFSIGGTAVVLATVGPHTNEQLPLTVAQLERAGGGTQAFRAPAAYGSSPASSAPSSPSPPRRLPRGRSSAGSPPASTPHHDTSAPPAGPP